MDMTVARAVWNQIQSSDYRLMHRVHRWRAPRWFRLFMIGATRMGDGWLWYAVGVVILLFGGATRFRAVGSAGLAVLLGIALFSFLKKASRRPRPCELEPHCWSMILPPDQFSFPSGHSITAFAIAMCLGAYYQDLQICLLAAAICIAASRIILGMHFLSDVLAGSAIGAFLGLACFHLFAYL
jgi:undecaprenyl-diphosphatase